MKLRCYLVSLAVAGVFGTLACVSGTLAANAAGVGAPGLPAPAPIVPGAAPPTPPIQPGTAPLTSPGTVPLTPPGTIPGTPGAATAPAIPGVGEPGAPGASTVVDVQFRGLTHLTKQLFNRLQTRVGAPLSEATILQDSQTIFDTGYFNNVRPRVEQGPTGATVVFDLDENPFITRIDIVGNRVIHTPELMKLMLTKVNSVLNTQLLHQDLLRIEDYYASKGYVYAHVLDVKPDANGVLQMTIGEGIIERIQIVGNHKTKPFVIYRAIRTKPGDVFNQKQWQEDLKAIARLNIFSDLHYTQTPGSELGKIVLILTVVEQRTGTVNFGFGYDTRERGVVFLDLADTNFRGRAESVDAQLELGGYETRGSYRFSFFEPWLGPTNYSAGINIYKQQTDRIVPGTSGNSVSGRYFETRTGAGVNLGKHLSLTEQLAIDLKSETIASDQIYGNVVAISGGSISSSSSNVSPFLLQGGQITSIAVRGIQDTRDLATDPRTGAYNEVLLEPGRGTFSNPGDTQSHPFNYLRGSLQLRKYIPVGAATHREDAVIQKVLAMRLLYGRTSPGVPAFQYFFLGGADTLRGYEEDNFFGENLFLVSSELRIPVALNKLQAVAFADAGDAWGGNYTPSKGFRLYTGVGVGVRVVIPQIGPLRLDYAVGKYGGGTHFSIGQTF